MRNNENGFVILLAMLIISAVSITAATVLLTRGADSSKSALITQQTIQARQLASACTEEALQQIRSSTSYTGTGNLSVGNGSCTYTVTNPGGTARSIATSGTVSSVVRRQQVSATIGSTSISITSWQDIP